MRTNPVKKVKRKRQSGKFVFLKKTGMNCLATKKVNFYLKEIPDVYALGDFAYHNFFTDMWTVFHVPTSILIKSYDTEKKAKIAVKRLHSKMRKEYKPISKAKYEVMEFMANVQLVLYGDVLEKYSTDEDVTY